MRIRWIVVGIGLCSLACAGGAETSPPVPDKVERTPPPKGPAGGSEVEEVTHQYGVFYDLACPGCMDAKCKASKVTASSSLKEGALVHGPERVLDEDPATAWCEGVDGDGKGESLTFEVPPGCGVYGLQIEGGYFKDEQRLKSNGRLAKVTVRSGSEAITATMDDPIALEFGSSSTFPASLKLSWFERAWRYPAFLELGWDAPGSTVTVTIDEIYPGAKSSDTCISDVWLGLYPLEE